MTPEDKEQLLRWGERQEKEVLLRLAADESDAGRQLSDFCNCLNALHPSIIIKKDEETQIPIPSIRVRENIRYQALPLGRELLPFLTALSPVPDEERSISQETASRLHHLKAPLLLKIYIFPQCPFCPQVVSQLLDLAAASDRVQVTVIDAALFPEKAAADNIHSVPTTILDGRFRWTGLFSMEEMIDMGLNQDPSKLSTDALRKMLEAGDAESAAKMMTESGKIFPALIELLIHEKWPVRLGAMVTVEYLAALDPQLADQLAKPLWQRFWTLPESVKGDVIHLFGQMSREAAAHLLDQILEKAADPDLVEAVMDAREQLGSSG